MCNNFGGCSWLVIIVLILLIFGGCGNGCGGMTYNNGCGCGNDCGCNNGCGC